MGRMMDEGDEGLILLLMFFLFSGFWMKKMKTLSGEDEDLSGKDEENKLSFRSMP